MSSYYFTMIGTRDNPIYELEFGSFKSSSSSAGQAQFSLKVKELLPFIANLALDLIEDAQWTSGKFHLGRVDSFYGIVVIGFVTQGNIKFVLCCEQGPTSSGLELMMTGSKQQDDTAIRQFFTEMYDLYVKALLNPFYGFNDAVVSPDFDHRAKLLAKKYL